MLFPINRNKDRLFCSYYGEYGVLKVFDPYTSLTYLFNGTVPVLTISSPDGDSKTISDGTGYKLFQEMAIFFGVVGDVHKFYMVMENYSNWYKENIGVEDAQKEQKKL